MKFLYLFFLIGSTPIVLGSGVLGLTNKYLPETLYPVIGRTMQGLAILIVFHSVSMIITGGFSKIYKYFKIKTKVLNRKDIFIHSLYMSVAMMIHFFGINYIIFSTDLSTLSMTILNLVLSVVVGYALKDSIDHIYKVKEKTSD